MASSCRASSRPLRRSASTNVSRVEAMPCRRVEEILIEGAGTQWDRRIVEAFQRCRQKIHAIRQQGVGESLCHAIDGALRADEGSAELGSQFETNMEG